MGYIYWKWDQKNDINIDRPENLFLTLHLFFCLEYCVSHQNMKQLKKKQGEISSQASQNDLDFHEVINQEEFIQLAQQIQLTSIQRSKLIDQLYADNQWSSREDHFTRNKGQYSTSSSPYQLAYQEWKEKQNNDCGFNETYASALALANNTKREAELNHLLKQHHVPNSVYQYTEEDKSVSQLKHLYSQQLKKILDRQPDPTDIHVDRWKKEERQKELVQKVIANNNDQVTKGKMVELAVQKELLCRIKKLDQEEREANEALQKEKKFQKTCFLDMVKRPPVCPNKQGSRQLKEKLPTLNNTQKQQEPKDLKIERSQPVPSPKYKLNLEEVLKIPYKQFLIFYADNYHQIVALSTPAELQAINQYRDKALEREEALEKLKKKVASYGPDQIAKLPPHSRQKLFRLLYQQDLEMQQHNTQ